MESRPDAEGVIQALREGNARFRSGKPTPRSYSVEDLRRIATSQNPWVAIVGCSDSRVPPDVIFDQPLGRIFASRVPGNVASDSAKWMIDIAVGEFKVPLLLVLGHSGCLAVRQVIAGQTGSGGILRHEVQAAVSRAKSRRPADLERECIEENARQTVDRLARDSYTLRTALSDGTTSCACAVYEMESGEVRFLDRAEATLGR